MRIVVAFLLLAHGVAHIVGFLGAWAPTRTTIVGNRIDLGPSWIKIVGVMWLFGTIGFGVAGFAAVVDTTWWQPLAVGLAAGSTTLCLLQLPDTKFGVALNIVLIAALVGQRVAWF